MSTIIIDNIGGEIIIQEPLRLVPKTLADGGVTEETDPIFTDSVAFGIDQADIDNWNNLTPTTSRFESAAFTISDADKNGYIRYTGATDISVTYPNSISVEAVTTFFQAGAGIITLVGDTGVVLNGNVKTAGQNTAMQTKKVADNLVDVIGGVE
jgi:hypothetical protein